MKPKDPPFVICSNLSFIAVNTKSVDHSVRLMDNRDMVLEAGYLPLAILSNPVSEGASRMVLVCHDYFSAHPTSKLCLLSSELSLWYLPKAHIRHRVRDSAYTKLL